MAPSLLSSFCVGFVLAFSSTAGAQDARGDREEIVFESGPLDFNGETNLVQAEAPSIKQGDLHITADYLVANGVDFDSTSEWRFRGNVRIAVGATVMNADSAVFFFEQERLARGELEGAPASFTHVDAERQKPASGTAGKIFVDDVARTLRLTGDVLFQRDRTEVRGCDIIYNMMTEGFSSGDSDCGIRMRRIGTDPEQPNAATQPQ